MNILLWVLQVALAFLCISGGVFQIIKIEELKKGVAAMRALPRGLWALLGAFACLCGVALIVPAAANLLPVLTAYAAAAVAAEQLLISAFYVHFRDFAPLPYSAAMTVMGAFVAYGRLALQPF